MSIINKRFSAAVLIFAELLTVALAASAQEIEATIKITPPDVVSVEGKFVKENPNQANVNWFFLNSIAGVENLGGRVSNFSLLNEENRAVAVRKMADGEYLADAPAEVFQYRMNLKKPANAAVTAHISSLSDERGILMFDDLLPQFTAHRQTVSANVKFALPVDWKIISSEKNIGANAFYVKNLEKAVFLVGKNWRESQLVIDKLPLSLAISGEWKFSDAEARQIISNIVTEYRQLFGEMPAEKVQVILTRFPAETKFGRWEAETRGATVTIFSGDMAFKTQSWQLLHEQLRHELFHLWMPNNLALTGNYDWFYEGFTVYQALRTGVSMNQIRFEDYLDTLAQAYNSDVSQNQRKSLIESAKNRRSGANKQIYARGMLVAFLCDAALLRASKGKRSIAEIFRKVYQKHRFPNEPEEGNAAILKVLKNYSELNPIIENFIGGVEKINWETDLESIGIEAKEENYVVRLKVKVKLNGGQKDLLGKLGYNNWRKTLER